MICYRMLDKTNQSGSGSIADPTNKLIKTFESIDLAADFAQYSAIRTVHSTTDSSVTFLVRLRMTASSLVTYTASNFASKG